LLIKHKALKFSHNLRYEEYKLKMDTKLIKEIEEQIADLKARWPAHSVPVSMWQELEELEEKLEQAKGKPGTNAR
jgi:hypothetical protein